MLFLALDDKKIRQNRTLEGCIVSIVSDIFSV